MTTEFKVGVVVLIGILILFYMSFRIGKFGVLTQGGYDVNARFTNVGGLDAKSPVQIAGVEVGRVKRIRLVGFEAKTTLVMRENVRIPSDSAIAIKSFGILGDKYLEIIPGKSTTFLKEGEEIKNVVHYADYDEIFANVNVAAKNFGETMEGLKGVLGDKEKQDIRQSLDNIRAVSGDFRQMVAENKANVKRVVTNVAEVSDKLAPMAERADSAITSINTIVKGVEDGKGTLGLLVTDDTIYKDAKETVASLKNMTTEIEQGKGTLGMLVKDDSLYVEARDTVRSIKGFTDGMNKEGGLAAEADKTMKKIQKAAEGVQEQTPITILGTIFGLFF